MRTATVPTWGDITTQAHRQRLAVLAEVRRWSARTHASTRAPIPTRAIATLDALSRPIRARLVERDIDTTDRDRADAAAADLWDGVAQTWSLVRSFDRIPGPPLEHVVAELVAAGRWLAEFPVLIERHQRELDKLFEAPPVASGQGREDR